MASFVENVNKVAALIPAESVDLGVVADNIDNINFLKPVITSLQSIVNNVVPNIAEILLADDNAATAITKAGEASTSASKALGYRNEALGFRNEAEAFNESKAFVVDAVEDLLTIPSSYVTAVVRDLNRGGTFVWSASGTANGGTVFAGVSGYWVRQYNGAVNVRWFGAKGDATSTEGTFQVTTTDNVVHIVTCDIYNGTNDRESFVSALALGVPIYVPSGKYFLGEVTDAFNGTNDIVCNSSIFGENDSILFNTRIVVKGEGSEVHDLTLMSSYDYDFRLPYPISTIYPAPTGYIYYTDLRNWKFGGEGVISEFHSNGKIYNIKTKGCASGYTSRNSSSNITITNNKFNNSWYHSTSIKSSDSILITDNVMTETITGFMCDMSEGTTNSRVSNNIGRNLAGVMKFENHTGIAVDNIPNKNNVFSDNTIVFDDISIVGVSTKYLWRMVGENNKFSGNIIKDIRGFNTVCEMIEWGASDTITSDTTLYIENNTIDIPNTAATLITAGLLSAKEVSIFISNNIIRLKNNVVSGIVAFINSNIGTFNISVYNHTQNIVGLGLRGANTVNSSLYIDIMKVEKFYNLFQSGAYSYNNIILKNVYIEETAANGTVPVFDLSGKTISAFVIDDFIIKDHVAAVTLFQNTSSSTTIDTMKISKLDIRTAIYNFLYFYTTSPIISDISLIENSVFGINGRFSCAISANNIFKNNIVVSANSSNFSNSSILIGNTFLIPSDKSILGTGHIRNTASILAGNVGL